MKDSAEDLSVRARRHELSSSDSRKLEKLLEASPEARLWHQFGCELDSEDTVQPGDHDTAQRVIGRLLSELAVKKPRSLTRFVALLAAATLALASVAGAAVLGVRRLNTRAPSPPPSSATASSPAERTPLPPPPPSAPVAAAAPTLAPTGSGSPRVDQVSVLAPKPGGSPPSAQNGPADLFSAAGQARRQGYAGQAITLLDSLQARFPNSPEARASDITLGMLQLKNGASASAFHHFDRYLQRAPGGELAAEALWGRAQALFALGRATEAHQNLSALLDRYPSSSYASAARAKLRTVVSQP